jgi:hypothetical protein
VHTAVPSGPVITTIMHDADATQPYEEVPTNSPPPYPHCDSQLPPEYVIHIDEPTEEPPPYNYYDVERGSFMDRALAQYAQSISPTVASSSFRYYSVLEQGENASSAVSALRDRFGETFVFCASICCGALWALAWICAIGYAVVVSVQRLSGNP